MVVEIEPVAGPFDAVVELPGSKSYTNRALLIAALAHGRSEITQALSSDDTRYMHAALEALGVRIDDRDAHTFLVTGIDGQFPSTGATLMVGNAGTAARFLTAAVALGHGTFIVDGSEAMRKRPIQPLIDGLRQLGVDIDSQNGNGCPPVEVRARGIAGGRAVMRGDISSQYFSALLMAAPYASADVEIEVEGELVSSPYVTMTLSTMAEFGVHAERDGDRWFRVPSGQRYQARTYAVEPDASAASYFFTAAAVTGGRVVVPRLGSRSAQGDLGILAVLERMGCRVRIAEDSIEVQGPARLRGVDADFTQMGDVATSLMAIAPFADGPTTVRGIAQTHYEESDRPVAAATELRRMGLRVESDWDSVTIYPGTPQPAEIQTYDDHRIAMSFAVTGLRASGIRIANPECVSKTFPEYFEVLRGLTVPATRH
ncbi:MAG: 3-phosphoshikimate 1-carboxyvinyltransferase [Dehalococcoidia bacterium]|nr:MAG: 3-phosphoshikimate 1-carboxyvinyltransferase [Dehalococcoidia bacterium]